MEKSETAERIAESIRMRLSELRQFVDPRREADAANLTCDESYDILIPIYNAYAHVKKCVESVLRWTGPMHRVYLLDDASTDERIAPLLEKFAVQDSRVHVLRAEKNGGFVDNVNRGFHLSKNSVVILNSDTEVTANWIERMHRCLRSAPNIGIVNPLSNNATILSVPAMNVNNELPEGMTVSECGQLVAAASRRVYPRIPTAVGFCMLISRRVLDRVGLFDTAYGMGYGEENDFCERAIQAGYEIACCDDAYVHHYGEASFSAIQAIDERRAENTKLLHQRWPDYPNKIYTFCRTNPLRDVQERVYRSLLRERMEERTPILHVLHNFDASGGTELHTRNIIDGIGHRYHSTVIFPHLLPDLWSDMSSEERSDHLRVLKMAKEPSIETEYYLGFAAGLTNNVVEARFARFLSGGDYEVVHFQHLLDWDSLLLPLIAKDMGKRVVLSLHDFFYLCPEYNFLLPSLKRCDKKQADATSNDCIYCLGTKRRSTVEKDPPLVQEYLGYRKHIVDAVIRAADVLIAPSRFVKDRFARVYGDECSKKCVVIGHGVEPLTKSARPKREKKFRVGFLGKGIDRKGVLVYLHAVHLLKDQPIRFELFGPAPGVKQAAEELGVVVHGSYDRRHLPRLLANIDLVVIPSIGDETYCLTLSEAQAMGIPVLAADVGAIPERIIDGETGFLFQAGEPKALAERLLALSRDPHSLDAVRKALAVLQTRTLVDNASDYLNLYDKMLERSDAQSPQQTVNDHESSDSCAPNRQVSIVILTFNGLAYTRQCIESLERTTRHPHEIIFVDNGSTDGTREYLKSYISTRSNCVVISNDENVGFPAGNNQGIGAAKGGYIVLMNNDVVLTEGWLDGLLECAESDPSVGIVGPMTNYISGIQRVEHVTYSSLQELPRFAREFRTRNRGRWNRYPRITGFCMLIKREVIDAIGGLDPIFGIGNYEDDDFCLRSLQAGFTHVVATDVFVHHHGGKSFRANGDDVYRACLAQKEAVFEAKWGMPVREVWKNGLLGQRKRVHLDLESRGVERLFGFGLQQVSAQHYAKALKWFEHAAYLMSELPIASGKVSIKDIHLQKGDCYLQLGQLQEAKEEFERALHIDPESAEICFKLGMCFEFAGIPQAARQMYECAVQLQPEWELAKQKVLECGAEVGSNNE